MGWSRTKQDATPAQFRKMLPRSNKEAVRVAKYAGRRIAQHMLRFNRENVDHPLWTVKHLSKEQIEHFRKAHGVPRRLTAAMLTVARAYIEYPSRHQPIKRKRKEDPLAAAPTWRQVKRRSRKQPEKKSNLAQRGAAIYRAFLARERKALANLVNRAPARVASPTLRRKRRKRIAVTPATCIQPQWKILRRLARVVMIEVGCCGKPVPIGASTFCAAHCPPTAQAQGAKPGGIWVEEKRFPRMLPTGESALVRVNRDGQEFYVPRAELEKKAAKRKKSRAVSFADLAAMQ